MLGALIILVFLFFNTSALCYSYVMKMKKATHILLAIVLAMIAGCATVLEKPEPVEAPVSKTQQLKAQTSIQLPTAKRYKRKIAIARFSNESNYGRTLMTDQDYDRIGKQASDMLASKLIKSNKFV